MLRPPTSAPHLPHLLTPRLRLPGRPKRSKSARFHRQSAVDHGDRGEGGERSEKGGGGGKTEIQVLMEGGRGGGEGSGGGGKGEYPRANSWSEDKRRGMLSKGGGGVSGRGTSRTNGHKQSSSNHKSREHGSSNHRQARGDSYKNRRKRRERGERDSVHKLDRPGEKMDSRPLRRDLTLSPPLKSSPITPEQQDHSLTQSKGNSSYSLLCLHITASQFSRICFN
ncbi:junctophilin-3 [Lates japonicus]|uniref:Junctophilin-3 n=1 Tax=Lates japonicus TaxID=270547 RepID=A0AAD3RHJ3_LATJO|nr:junctophilin-3 [Lates japonicus]